jgi:STE24 endopeptidase
VAAIVLRLAVLAAATWATLASGLAARMRDAAQRITRRAWLQDAAVAVPFLAIVLALGLPVEVFAGFVRFRDAGLSNAGFGQWLSDYVLQWAVDLVFYVVGIVAIVALIRRQPRAWPALATLVYVALYATYTLVAPIVIDPLFNRYTQLADGPARASCRSPAPTAFPPTASTSRTRRDKA